MLRALLLFGLIAAATPAVAAVVDAADNGFTCRNTVTIDAMPDRVWTALTGSVGRWWHSDHTWSGDAANLTIDARPGGMFSEQLPGGGSVEHLRVIYAQPGRMLRLDGGLGPLQGMAVSGRLTFELAAEAGKTVLTATYTVGGYTPDGLAAIAGPVDGVIRQQIERLGAFVER